MPPDSVGQELSRFDPSLPIEKAWTPPASWYLRPEFLARERDRVFNRSWQAVGRLDQVQRPGDYFTGCLDLDVPRHQYECLWSGLTPTEDVPACP